MGYIYENSIHKLKDILYNMPKNNATIMPGEAYRNEQHLGHIKNFAPSNQVQSKLTPGTCLKPVLLLGNHLVNQISTKLTVLHDSQIALAVSL
jgi:hypothetical protein